MVNDIVEKWNAHRNVIDSERFGPEDRLLIEVKKDNREEPIYDQSVELKDQRVTTMFIEDQSHGQ